MTREDTKQAFVIQSAGAEGRDYRKRADLVFEQLIEPACREAEYEAVRGDRSESADFFEPIISPLATSPLVIVDLAKPPWDDDMLLEIGFRLANGRPAVMLVDEEADDHRLPVHIQELQKRMPSDFLRIDPSDLTDQDQRRLVREIRRYEAGSRGWQSHYPMVEFSVPLLGGGQPRFVSVNEAAAKLYGFDSAAEMLAKSVDSADKQLKDFMPEVQKQQFEEDQATLFGVVIDPRNKMPALAKIPAWIPKHPKAKQRSRIYWPIMLQHKFSTQANQVHSVVMRVAFVPIEHWDARGPEARELAEAIRLPELFRPEFEYDVFLSYNSADREIVSTLAAALRRFNLRVWFDEQNLTDRGGLTAELKTAMRESRIIAAVLGKDGLGPWQDTVELRASLLSIASGRQPFVLLLTDEISVEDDEWLQYVPIHFKDIFRDRLYVQLPPVEKLAEIVSSPVGSTFSLMKRMIQLLADAIHAEYK